MTKHPTSPFRTALGGTLLILGLLGIVATGPATAESEHTSCGHAHVAPHGGALIPVGDHVAHVELLLDQEAGTVRLYVLGAHAERPIRIEDQALTIELRGIHGEKVETASLTLDAVANPLTGETVGDTSEFTGGHPELVDASRFEGKLKQLNVRGVAFMDVAIAVDLDADHHDRDHEPFDPEDDDAY